MTNDITVTQTWQKITDGEGVVIQNKSTNLVEIATVPSGSSPSSGFLLRGLDVFSYPGGLEVWVRSVKQSIITIDKVS